MIARSQDPIQPRGGFSLCDDRPLVRNIRNRTIARSTYATPASTTGTGFRNGRVLCESRCIVDLPGGTRLWLRGKRYANADLKNSQASLSVRSYWHR